MWSCRADGDLSGRGGGEISPGGRNDKKNAPGTFSTSEGMKLFRTTHPTEGAHAVQ